MGTLHVELRKFDGHGSIHGTNNAPQTDAVRREPPGIIRGGNFSPCLTGSASTRITYYYENRWIHILTWWRRDQSRSAPNQRETSLQCNDVSHWLGAYLDRSLVTSWHWNAFRLTGPLRESTGDGWFSSQRSSNTELIVLFCINLTSFWTNNQYAGNLWRINAHSTSLYVRAMWLAPCAGMLLLNRGSVMWCGIA